MPSALSLKGGSPKLFQIDVSEHFLTIKQVLPQPRQLGGVRLPWSLDRDERSLAFVWDSQQSCSRHPQHVSQSLHVINGDVCKLPLYMAHVGAMKPPHLSQSFLCDTSSQAKGLKICGQQHSCVGNFISFNHAPRVPKHSL